MISYRKVGGLHFLKIGRFTFMACRSRKRAAQPALRRNRRGQRLSANGRFVLSDDGALVMGFADEATRWRDQ